jgi:hypothetical protein
VTGRAGHFRLPLCLMIPPMGVWLLGDVARTAVIAMYLSALSCIIAAAFAVPMSTSPFQPADAAFRLARLMALLGAVSGFIFGVTGAAYFWLAGHASDQAFVVTEMALMGGIAVFLIAVAMLHQMQHSRSRPR